MSNNDLGLGLSPKVRSHLDRSNTSIELVGALGIFLMVQSIELMARLLLT